MENNDEKSTAVTLAPGAGSGIVQEVARELLSRPPVIKKMADALERGLTAVRRTWDSGSKQWVDEPDTRSQLQAVFGCFAHFVGDPSKRIIHEYGGSKSLDRSLADALVESPQLEEQLQAQIDKARRQRGRKEKAAEPVVLE